MSTQPAKQPPITGAELIIAYQDSPNNEIAEQLIKHYEPMVRMAAGKISRNRPDLYEDLMQVGQIALLRLFSQFDSSLGVQFEPYAMKSIIGHMKNYLRDKSWYVQVPRRIKEKGIAVQQAIDELTVRLERSPKVEEIAAQMALSVEETTEILAGRDLYHYVSTRRFRKRTTPPPLAICSGRRAMISTTSTGGWICRQQCRSLSRRSSRCCFWLTRRDCRSAISPISSGFPR